MGRYGKLTSFFIVLISYSFAVGQQNANHSIRLTTPDGTTYFSPDNWKTLRIIDKLATVSETRPGLSLPNNTPDNLLWQQSYEGISTSGDSSFSIPTTLIQLNDGGYFCASLGINLLNRLTKVHADGTPGWTSYKGDLALPLYISSCVEEQSQIRCYGWRQGSSMNSIGGYIYSLNLSPSGVEQTSYYNYSEKGWIQGNTYHGLTRTPSGFVSLGWVDVPLDTDHVVLNYSHADLQGSKLVDTSYDLWNNHTLETYDAIYDDNGSTLFCVGRMYSSIPHVFNTSDIIVLKIDTLGNIKWSKSYGGQDEILQPRRMLSLTDGYLIVGRIFIPDPEGWGVFLLRIDKEGNKQWLKVHRTTNNTSPTSAIVTKDGGYLIGGSAGDYSRTHSLWWTNNMYLLRLSADGDKVWDRTWGQDSSEDVITAIVEDQQRNIVIAGYTGATDDVLPANARLYMAKLSDVPASVDGADQATKELKVYPNPTHRILTIVLPDNSRDVQVINSLGVIVGRFYNNDQLLKINVGHYPTGTYLIRTDNATASFIVE
jgi:hypothetical protein